jgi:hypothetical protein
MEYEKIIIVDESIGSTIIKNVNFTNIFFIYVQDNPCEFPIKRLNWTTCVLNKNTYEILPTGYAKNSDEYPFIARCRKMKFRMDESDVININKSKQDELFTNILNETKLIEGNIKCLYVTSIIWSHIFDPTMFCPIPGILFRYFAYKGEQ